MSMCRAQLLGATAIYVHEEDFEISPTDDQYWFRALTTRRGLRMHFRDKGSLLGLGDFEQCSQQQKNVDLHIHKSRVPD